MLNCEMSKAAYPWTAEFTDGSTLSSRTHAHVNFDTLRARLQDLQKFTIHFENNLDVSVRLADGAFKYGTHDWEFHPDHIQTNKYSLYYSRRCQGLIADGKIKAEVVGYLLGYKTPGIRRCMELNGDGEFTWC